MSETIAFDSGKAIDFLASLPGGVPCISAVHIDPSTHKKGLFETRTFPADSPGAASFAWVEGRQRRANLYYTLHPLMEPMNKKPGNKDIKEVVAFHVDVDPREGEDLSDEQVRILKKLQEFKPRPHVVIKSGGGYQALWFLKTPIPINGDNDAAEDAKLYNIALERALGGDHCHDISHILRVPFTVNVAHDLKKRRGRPDFSETGIEWDERKTLAPYEVSAFQKAKLVDAKEDKAMANLKTAFSGLTEAPLVKKAGKQEVNPDKVNVEQWNNINALSERNLEPMALITLQYCGEGEDALTKKFEDRGWEMKNGKPFGGDRSDRSHFLIHALVRAGLSNEEIAGVVKNHHYMPAFAHIHDQTDDKKKWRALTRSLEKARDTVTLDKYIEVTGFKAPGGMNNKTGKPEKNIENTLDALEVLGFYTQKNTFNNKTYVFGDLLGELNGSELNKRSMLSSCDFINKKLGFFPNDGDISRAFETRAYDIMFNPVMDEIKSVVWDGTKRVEEVFIKYFGALDTPLHRGYTRKFFAGLVRRAKEPGCKFDHMLVLDGLEGLGKSLFFQDLAVHSEWFSDQPILHKTDKEQMELLQGIWVFEVGELTGLNRADSEGLKAFVTRREDKGRMAYERFVESYKRTCVLAGTSNIRDYMRDDIGIRRFWPISVLLKYFEMRDEFIINRRQIMAEAAILELTEKLWLDTPELQEAHLIACGARRAPDPIEERLSQVLTALHPVRKEKICRVWPVAPGEWRIVNTDLYDFLELPIGQASTVMHRRISGIMTQLGWKMMSTRLKGATVKAYTKPHEQGELIEASTSTNDGPQPGDEVIPF